MNNPQIYNAPTAWCHVVINKVTMSTMCKLPLQASVSEFWELQLTIII